jgi:hypothetical protein
LGELGDEDVTSDQTAAGVLARLRAAQELMEEVEILLARDLEVLRTCSFENARDICQGARKIDAVEQELLL